MDDTRELKPIYIEDFEKNLSLKRQLSDCSWPYLLEDSFQVRHQIAAHFLKDLPQIVEIGGYLKNISSYLSQDQHYIGLDPLSPHVNEHNKKIYPVSYELLNTSVLKDTYGLACLGLDFPLYDDLLDIIEKSSIVVLEHSVTWMFSVSKTYQIKSCFTWDVIAQISIEIPNDTSGNNKREVFIAKPLKRHSKHFSILAKSL